MKDAIITSRVADVSLLEEIRDREEQIGYLTGDCINFKGKIKRFEKDAMMKTDHIENLNSAILNLQKDIQKLIKNQDKQLEIDKAELVLFLTEINNCVHLADDHKAELLRRTGKSIQELIE